MHKTKPYRKYCKKKKAENYQLFTVDAQLIALLLWYLPIKREAVSSLGS